MINDNMEINTIPNSPFQYSNVVPENLGNSEYTLTTFVTDISGSVSGYVSDLEKALDTSLESCKKSPRSDNILARALMFDTEVKELHGFSELSKIFSYSGKLICGGCTALFDAVYNAIGATVDFANKLKDQYMNVNAIIYVITDGCDNSSSYRAKDIKDLVDSVVKKEELGFLTVVLIGVDSDPSVKSYLEDFKNDANITKYVSLGEATPAKLAHLAGFIQQSISSSSQSLANGTPFDATNLTF
jgi:hypothetical protein